MNNNYDEMLKRFGTAVGRVHTENGYGTSAGFALNHIQMILSKLAEDVQMLLDEQEKHIPTATSNLTSEER